MNILKKIRAWLKTLFARKLLIAFVVGFLSAFVDAIIGISQSQQPITTSLIEGAIVGAFATALRGLLALSPLNLVPSDANHSITLPAAKANVQISGIDPHPEYVKHGNFAHLKTGRLPVRHDPRTLQLSRYLTSKLPKAPTIFGIWKAVAIWPMYGNDRLGDCTCAAAGHMIEAWTAASGALKTVAANAITRTYWLTGTPSSTKGTAGGPTDTGRVELDILKFWRTTGISGHKIGAFTSVQPKNHSHMKAGTWLLGGLYVGIALPITAQTQQVWDVVGDGKTGNSAPGSWGGHAIDIVGYDSQGLIGVTWGALIKITWAFVDAYFEEAYAIISNDWLTQGATPAGLNLAQLQKDLAAL